MRNHDLKDIKPIDGKILIKLHGAKTEVVLKNPEMNEPEGEVLAVGPGYRRTDGGRDALMCTVGDLVLLGAAKVTPIRVDNADCFIVGENAVEAIVGRVGVTQVQSSIKIVK